MFATEPRRQRASRPPRPPGTSSSARPPPRRRSPSRTTCRRGGGLTDPPPSPRSASRSSTTAAPPARGDAPRGAALESAPRRTVAARRFRRFARVDVPMSTGSLGPTRTRRRGGDAGANPQPPSAARAARRGLGRARGGPQRPVGCCGSDTAGRVFSGIRPMASSAIRNQTWSPSGPSSAPNQKVPFGSRVGSRAVRVLAPPGSPRAPGHSGWPAPRPAGRR